MSNLPEQSKLGQVTDYVMHYQPELLFPIPREIKRIEIGIASSDIPFYGEDLWTGYEVSWLNKFGKPEVAIMEFAVPCSSPFLIESKSIKLYLVSLTQTRFENWRQVAHTIQTDLSKAAKADVMVELFSLNDYFELRPVQTFTGYCLDSLDISIDHYHADPALLKKSDKMVSETVYSDLLKSNCLVTGQPDWGSVQIIYSGAQIRYEGLLEYLIGFRLHQEFHEQCVERIFMDIMGQCQPAELTVYARYTRRGGLDINPIRSTSPIVAPRIRLVRQ